MPPRKSEINHPIERETQLALENKSPAKKKKDQQPPYEKTKRLKLKKKKMHLKRERNKRPVLESPKATVTVTT
jgi:hypothetical protein